MRHSQNEIEQSKWELVQAKSNLQMVQRETEDYKIQANQLRDTLNDWDRDQILNRGSMEQLRHENDSMQ